MDQNLFIHTQTGAFLDMDKSYMYDAMDEADSIAFMCGEMFSWGENRPPIWWMVFVCWMYGA